MPMQRSEQIGELVKALAKSQSEFKPVPKNKTAKVKGKTKAGADFEYQYKYADLADILSMALPILSANGISFLQPHVLVGNKLRVVTLLMHGEQWMQSDGIEISEDGDPQQFGAESTYFRRYDGASFIGVAPDEDTDAQQAGPRTRKPDPVPDVVKQAQPLSDDVLTERVKLISEAANVEALQAMYKDAYRIAQLASDDMAVKLFTAAKDDRKKALSAK